jgi:hypothetical protein
VNFTLTKFLYESQIVRGDDHRDTHFLKALKELHDVTSERVIEIAGGLIGDEDRGSRDNGARDTNALLFADG